jgi:ribonuclease BN (tRNA processing enzyme)
MRAKKNPAGDSMEKTTSGPEQQKRVEAESTTVVLLGTGMPRPDPNASGPATAVVVGKRLFLVDAGPGLMRQLAAAQLPIDGVTALFVTHLHSDHTLGYPDLIFTSWVMGRKDPLHAYGPHGFKQMTDHLVAAYSEDIKVRTEGLEHQTPDGFRVNANEIEPGVIYAADGVRVQAMEVAHGSWEKAFAFRIDTPSRSVVVSGDTRPHEGLVRLASGVDVLVHEVYASSKLRPESRLGGEDWPRYMQEYHTSDVELGSLASRIKPELLVLSHIIRMGASDEELLAGVRAGGFTGRVVVGRDLDRC